MLDRPPGPMWEEQVGRAAGGTGIKKSENKGLIICWSKRKQKAWLEIDCLLEICWLGQGAGPVGGTEN